MGVIVLLIIGYVIWKIMSSGSPSVQTEEDKEFEDMCLSLKDTDDDFNIF